jgi:hypothetical protein
VLETIDARSPVRQAPRGVGGWNYRRSARGVTSFTHPEPPPGVSMCSYSRTPEGEHRVRLEGNLTSLLHGPDKACYSLTSDEVPAAVGAFLDTADVLLDGSGVPGPSGWDVHRLDPSMTYALPAGLTAAEVVVAAHQVFRLLANGRQVVSLHNDQTTTLRFSKWRSVVIYDKSAEAKAKGILPDADLLRIEHRIRPRNASGEWKAMSPNLAQVDAMLAKSQTDSMTLFFEVAEKVSASGQLALVRALIRGGASINAALRLASVVQLQKEFGGSVFESLGAAQSSAERWRSEVRRYLKASGGEEAILEDIGALMEQMVPAFAAEHDVTITKKPRP